MKNVTRMIMALMLMFASAAVSAQYTYTTVGISSYRPDVPHRVARAVRNYNGYSWVGTRHMHRGHREVYVVMLQKRNLLIELTMDRRGRVISKRRIKMRRNHFRPPQGRAYGYWGNGQVYWSAPYYSYSRQHDGRKGRKGWDRDHDRDRNRRDRDRGNDRYRYDRPGKRNR